MVDLAYTPEDLAKEKERYAPCVAGDESKGPKYPWGLGICLDNSSLEKLGKSVTDFKPGSTIMFEATAMVTGISSEANADGSKREDVRLTITGIDFDEEKSEEVVAKKMFKENA